MARMMAVGKGRLTQALTAAGFEPAVCETPADLAEALARLAGDPEVGFVVCGESQAVEATEAVDRFRVESEAMLLVLPDTPEPQRVGFELVRKTVEQAAGADLLGRVARERKEP